MRQQPLATFGVARMIHFALAGGVATFAVVVLVLGPEIAADPDGEPLDTLPLFTVPVIAAIATVACAMGIFLSRLLSSVPNKRIPAALEEIEAGKVPPEHVRGGIAGAATAEAGGLFACVAALITGETAMLAFAGVVVLVVLWLAPTPGRSRSLLE